MAIIANLNSLVEEKSNEYLSNNTETFRGLTGDSAYAIAVSNGFVGTESEWITHLEEQGRVGNTIGNTLNNTVGNTTGNTLNNTNGNTLNNTAGNTTGNTIGNTPAHKWSGTSLSFSTNDDKTEFGESVDLKGQQAYSDSEIKTKYEANSDTNSYTDIAKGKVDKITVTSNVNLDELNTIGEWN